MKKILKIAVRLVLLSLIMLATFSINIRPSKACTTTLPPTNFTPPASLKERVALSDLIFEGTVVAVNPNFGSSYAAIKVDRYFKGEKIVELEPKSYYPQISLGYYCSVNASLGDHALFYARQTQYGIMVLNYSGFGGKEIVTPETVAQLIELVGQAPVLPQQDFTATPIPSTTQVDPVQTPLITSDPKTTFTPEASLAERSTVQIGQGEFPFGIFILGICTLVILVGIVAWLGSRPVNDGKK